MYMLEHQLPMADRKMFPKEARELLPWTAGPGAQKNFDPEHPLARDSKGSSLALVLYLIQFVSCPSSLALSISHSLPIPRGFPLPARSRECI